MGRRPSARPFVPGPPLLHGTPLPLYGAAVPFAAHGRAGSSTVSSERGRLILRFCSGGSERGQRLFPQQRKDTRSGKCEVPSRGRIPPRHRSDVGPAAAILCAQRYAAQGGGSPSVPGGAAPQRRRSAGRAQTTPPFLCVGAARAHLSRDTSTHAPPPPRCAGGATMPPDSAFPPLPCAAPGVWLETGTLRPLLPRVRAWPATATLRGVVPLALLSSPVCRVAPRGSPLPSAAPPGSDGTRRTQRSLRRTARRPQRSAGRRSPLRSGAPFGGFRRKERRGCPLPLPAFLLLLLLLAPSSRPPRSASGARSHRGAQTAPAAAALAHNGAETHQQGERPAPRPRFSPFFLLWSSFFFIFIFCRFIMEALRHTARREQPGRAPLAPPGPGRRRRTPPAGGGPADGPAARARPRRPPARPGRGGWGSPGAPGPPRGAERSRRPPRGVRRLSRIVRWRRLGGSGPFPGSRGAHTPRSPEPGSAPPPRTDPPAAEAPRRGRAVAQSGPGGATSQLSRKKCRGDDSVNGSQRRKEPAGSGLAGGWRGGSVPGPPPGSPRRGGGFGAG